MLEVEGPGEGVSELEGGRGAQRATEGGNDTRDDRTGSVQEFRAKFLQKIHADKEKQSVQDFLKKVKHKSMTLVDNSQGALVYTSQEEYELLKEQERRKPKTISRT